MAAGVLPIRNLVIEWRFPAAIGTYGAMDEIGVRFAERFPDWQRSPLTLELRSRKRNDRFYISYQRCFFDRIGTNDAEIDGAIDLAVELFSEFKAKAGVTNLTRIGLRSWTAFPREQPFDQLVRKFTEKFHCKDPGLAQSLLGSVNDSGYTTEVTVAEGWKYKMWAGPMARSQWFELVHHEPGLFESKEAFDEFRKTIPERFLFLDIDCHKTELPPGDVYAWARSAIAMVRGVVKNLEDYFNR